MSGLSAVSRIAELGVALRVEHGDIALTAPRGTVTPELIAEIRSAKSALLHDLTDLAIRAEGDWPEISRDPAQLKAFAEMVAIENMRHQGTVPDHYVETTICRHCGPVPVWAGFPLRVLGCPWCFNRLKGLPIPVVSN
jgi:hypothetical protein